MRLALLLLLLSLFDPQWGLAGNRFHERNHTGLLTLFGFDDGQRSSDLHPTSARDYTGLGLLGNLTTSTSAITWSANRAGFEIPSIGGGSRAMSQQTTERLLSRFTDEVTIELFLSSPTNPSGNVMVAGFGDWSPGAAFLPCESADPTIDGGWKLYSATGNSLRFQIVLAFGEVPTCYEVSFIAPANLLRHCAIRVRNGELSVYSHDSMDELFSPTVTFRPQLWARHFAPFTIAPPQPTSAWRGSLYMFAMFNRFLSVDEIEENRVYGPPNSLPVASAAASPLATTEDVTTTLYP